MPVHRSPKKISSVIFLAAIATLYWPQPAAAQIITEFTIPTAASGAFAITAGPDGALWFTELNGNKIGRITTAGVITEFSVPTATSSPAGITAGPDGNLWFAESNVAGNKIGRITPAGAFTEFTIPTASAVADYITAGPDGNLWFTELATNQIGRVTPAGVITEFTIPTANSSPTGIAAGPDGNLWFVEQAAAANKIGRITTSGTVNEFAIPTPNSTPLSIAAGPDGAMWFTEFNGNKLGRITVAGVITEFPVSGSPYGIAAGPDGALWFTQNIGNKIGRLTTAGAFSDFAIPTANSQPRDIAVGADGALWFVESAAVGNKVGRITTLALQVSPPANIAVSGNAGGLFSPPTFNYVITAADPSIGYTVSGAPNWLNVSSTSGTVGSSGTKTINFSVNGNANLLAPGTYGPVTITFANSTNGLGTTTRTATLTVGPAVTLTTALSAVLPASRSVQVGTPATAFATILNTGATAGTACGLSFGGTVPAAFSYQTTDPATNALTGTPNTPVSIPRGGNQSYVFAITPNSAFAATDVPVTAGCSNSAPAPTVVGLNTLLLSGSVSPVADIVALAASTDPGYVVLPGANGVGAFSVATVNVGAADTITVTGDTGSASLPVAITLCQTNSSGACINPPTIPAASATLPIAANATPTFSIFVTGSGNVPNDPAVNRVFVRFKDSGGVTRGATSVAVRTQ